MDRIASQVCPYHYVLGNLLPLAIFQGCPDPLSPSGSAHDVILCVLSSGVAIKSLPGEDRTGPEVIKLFLCSSQVNTKFILLINVKCQQLLAF